MDNVQRLQAVQRRERVRGHVAQLVARQPQRAKSARAAQRARLHRRQVVVLR